MALEPANFPKKCPTCKTGYGERAWKMLPLVGHQDIGFEDVVAELRNCPCGSTIAIEVPRER